MPMLVLGLGRSSRQFPGRSLVDNPTTGTLWVVRQLANLCAHSKTRYGYILTDEDFVACCFSVKNVVNGVSEWTVAVKAVPWTKAGDTELTTDLALWWLCMLAVSGSRNRRLVAEEDTIGIDQWDEYLVGDSGGWVRRHHYSLLEEAIDPPAPPAYRSPSPSDADTVDADFNDNAESALEHSKEAGFDLNEEPMLTLLPELDNDWNNWFQINVLQRDSEE
ncbi:hypothetical protein GGS24DRAFT_482241 [Hypoxylon argillaceum]|nr:hypothetical protein GGS24DRAFT_482241 [Hypoxylon argillaceum]